MGGLLGALRSSNGSEVAGAPRQSYRPEPQRYLVGRIGRLWRSRITREIGTERRVRRERRWGGRIETLESEFRKPCGAIRARVFIFKLHKFNSPANRNPVFCTLEKNIVMNLSG
eukprot:586846-Amorphochlora_amoeboformis.AAC.2